MQPLCDLLGCSMSGTGEAQYDRLLHVGVLVDHSLRWHHSTCCALRSLYIGMRIIRHARTQSFAVSHIAITPSPCLSSTWLEARLYSSASLSLSLSLCVCVCVCVCHSVVLFIFCFYSCCPPPLHGFINAANSIGVSLSHKLIVTS